MDTGNADGVLGLRGDAVMHTKRLFLGDLSDQHLTLLLRAVQYSYDATIEGWLAEVNSGMLALFELADGRGLIGMKRYSDHLYIEFLVGRDLRPWTQQILKFVRTTAGGLPIEALVTRPGLVKYYGMLGFRPIGTWMRFSDGRSENPSTNYANLQARALGRREAVLREDVQPGEPGSEQDE